VSKGCEYVADINPGTMPKNGSLPALAQGGTATRIQTRRDAQGAAEAGIGPMPRAWH